MDLFQGRISWITENKFISQIVIILVVFFSSLYGGMIWNGIYWVQIAFLISVIIFIALSLFEKNRDLYAKLPRVDIEWAIVISILAILSSWLISPVPRQGIWRVSSILSYFCLFYLLIDLIKIGLKVNRILFAFFLVVGLYLFSAVLEVYLAYQSWFSSISTNEIFPPTIYRFTSLIGHSNALMAVANLLAPIGVIRLYQEKERVTKISLMLWLLLYVIAIPFSSSRGGFIGILSWCGVLAIYILFFHKSEFLIKHRKTIITISIVLAVIFSILILIFGGYILAHPSHGNNPFASRETMWGDAIKILGNHFWLGAGPGRIPFEILNVNSSIPPNYFPNHVHSTWLQILAEFGVMGGLAFSLLNIQGMNMLIKKWKSLSEDMKLSGIAFMASFCAFFFHSILDDFSGWAFIIIIFIGLLAIFLTMQPDNIKVWREINVRSIFIPITILLCASVYSVWSQAPFRKAITAYNAGNIESSADLIEQSIKRDSNSSYLYTQAALEWSKIWEQTSDEIALENARSYFGKSIEIESSPSFLWADLAVLDWYAGDHVIALEHIRKAISISDQESSHYLIYGYFLELMNRNEDALEAYQSVIMLAPATCSHPFWQSSNLRSNFSCDLDTGIKRSRASLYYLNQALDFIENDELHQAQIAIEKAKWIGEPAIAINVAEYELTAVRNEGNIPDEKAKLILQNDLLSDNYFGQPLYHLIFSRWIYRTKGLDFNLVPGYMQVAPDYGQFEIANNYINENLMKNDKDADNPLIDLYQTALFAGALDSTIE
jgi:tetratricopeptide (TPR) repeat protein